MKKILEKIQDIIFYCLFPIIIFIGSTCSIFNHLNNIEESKIRKEAYCEFANNYKLNDYIDKHCK